MNYDVRCSKLQARLVTGPMGALLLEVKCDSRICRKQPGVVVLHYFSLSDGRLLETKRYRDPVVPGIREEVKTS